MTKEKLLEWGLTEEQAAKVMEGLNGSFVTKARFNEVNTELTAAKNTIKERDTQLETLKKASGDTKALQDQITQLQADTEVFRQRYMDSLNAQAFGGNRADYLEKVNAIPGVGGVKVYRVWNSDLNPAKLIPPTGTDTWISGLSGVSEEIKAWLNAVYAAGANSKLTVGGTVKLVIINSSFKKPSEALVDQVQTAVDPLQNAGEGVGIAPIGHVVRVEGVGEDTINLSFDLYYQREWSWDDVSAYVAEAINGYFLELAQSWADQNEALVVRISQVESRLLGITGILDIANTKINGEAANCTLTLDHIPVLGTIEPGTIVING